MSEAITRRKALSTIAAAGAAVTAVAVPAVAATAAAAAHPDAQLLALGEQFDEFLKKFNASVAHWMPIWDEQKAFCEEWRKNNPGGGDFGQAYGELLREAEEKASLPHPDDLMDDANEMLCAILAAPATTLAGVGVKARLARSTAGYMWKASDNDADWDHLCIRNVIDAVIGAAGDRRLS